MDTIAQRASEYTGRNLKWCVEGEIFHLFDYSGLGDLALAIAPGRGLREVYMRARHFGLSQADLLSIEAHLRDKAQAPRLTIQHTEEAEKARERADQLMKWWGLQ